MEKCNADIFNPEEFRLQILKLKLLDKIHFDFSLDFINIQSFSGANRVFLFGNDFIQLRSFADYLRIDTSIKNLKVQRTNKSGVLKQLDTSYLISKLLDSIFIHNKDYNAKTVYANIHCDTYKFYPVPSSVFQYNHYDDETIIEYCWKIRYDVKHTSIFIGWNKKGIQYIRFTRPELWCI